MKIVINTEFIKARRKLLGLTQQDVAHAIGLKSKGHYCKLEKGDYRLFVDHLMLLSLILKCDTKDLIKKV